MTTRNDNEKKPAGAATPTGRTVKPGSPSTETDITKADATTSERKDADEPANVTKDSSRYTEREMERALERLRDYRARMAQCQEAFRFAEDIALSRLASSQRISGSELIEMIRSRDFTDCDGMPFKPNNDWAPLLVRDLVRVHPAMRPHVQYRTTVYDRLEGADYGI